MRIIIVGAGEVGYHLSQLLSVENHDVYLIDPNVENLERAQESLDIITVEGNGASLRILEKAGIEDADMLIAVTDVDEVNMVACLLAQHYGVEQRIARVQNSEYTDELPDLARQKLGIDLLINPEVAVAEEIVRLVQMPGISDVATFADGQVTLTEMPIHEGDELCNMNIQELGQLRKLCSFLVVAIRRRDELIIPTGRDVFQAGDQLYIISQTRMTAEMFTLMGKATTPPKTAFISSGGQIAVLVAKRLEALGMKLKLLSRNRKTCEELAGDLAHTLILHGDPKDPDIYISEEVGQADVFLALSSDDETNLLAALLARQQGSKWLHTLIQKPGYLTLARNLGIDVVISPRMVTANAILRLVRRGEILSVARVGDERAEILEMRARAGSHLLDQPLATLKFPRGCIIGALQRGNKVLIPSGDDVIQAGDRVIVCALRSAISAVEKLFT